MKVSNRLVVKYTILSIILTVYAVKKSSNSVNGTTSAPSTNKQTDFVSVNTTIATELNDFVVKPTWRPKRVNCTPPAIEQFPKPIIGLSARRHGMLIIHLLLALYTFFG